MHKDDDFTPKVEPKTPVVEEKPESTGEVPEERKAEWSFHFLHFY
jgi:hypothetical protein